jgi:hypothetical protein
LKVKTLRDNVQKYGDKKGTILEVSEELGKHWIKAGVVEEVKPAQKKEAPKKTTKKKDEKEGE